MAATDPSTPTSIPPIEPVAIEPETARATAEEILSRSEFQPQPPSLLSRFFGWLGDVLGGGPQDPGSASMGAPSALRVLVWAVLAALVVLVVVLLVRSARGMALPRRRRRAKISEVDEISALPDAAANPTVGSLSEFDPGEVDALEAAGRWRDALLARYRGAVTHLSGAGVVDAQPATSSAELRAVVDAHHSELSAHFAQLTATFETVWYGGADADEALAADARRHAAAVDAAMTSAVGSKPPATTNANTSSDGDGKDLSGGPS